MTTPNDPLPETREIAPRLLPACRCGQSQSGKWAGSAESKWLVIKPNESEPKDKQLIEYECLSCNRRYRLRGTKLYEVSRDGTEHPYMRQGQYGRWLSCR